MPFGANSQYRNFSECVSVNRSKRNPQAYCATIMRATEGKKKKRKKLLAK